MLKSIFGFLLAVSLLTPLSARAEGKSGLNPNDFNIDANKASAGASSSSQPAQPQDSLFPGPLFETDVNAPNSTDFQTGAQQQKIAPQVQRSTSASQNSNQTQQQNTPSGQSGSSGCSNQGGTVISTTPLHPVIIRLKRYRALQEMEVVWEAGYMANIMIQQGGDVTILLDMDAVHAANPADTSFAGLEPYRGNGNQSAPPATTPQDQFKKFIAGGGKLVANKRWAQIFGMIGGYQPAVVAGTKLVTDEEIAQLLLRQGTEVIDY